MPIEHFCIVVPPSEHKKVVAFYLAALKPLGYTQKATYGADGEVAGLGAETLDFWITAKPDAPAKLDLHVAFSTQDRSVVDAFHAAALEAGANDHGAPGVRAHYHPNYYAAYVMDPFGINCEVVCSVPPSGA